MTSTEKELPWLSMPEENPLWKGVATVQIVYQHRTGWAGVWDAFKAAITKNDRVVVPVPTQLDVWIHTENIVKDAITIVSPIGELTAGYGVSYTTYVNGSQVSNHEISP